MDLSFLCKEDKDMKDWWKEINDHHSKEEAEQIGIILWTIWNYRNQISVNNERMDEQKLMLWVKRNLEEQRKHTSSLLPEIRLESLRNHDFWTPPPQNFLKLNSDASWNESLKVGGIGWIIRNSSGSLVKAGYKCIN